MARKKKQPDPDQPPEGRSVQIEGYLSAEDIGHKPEHDEAMGELARKPTALKTSTQEENSDVQT